MSERTQFDSTGAPPEPPRDPVVTLSTDFGTADGYVAQMKGVLLRAAPRCRLVDVVHEVPPGAIATADFLLGAAAPEFPIATVHLVVVDPGVGSDRRRIAVQREGWSWVGPDNGVLTHAILGFGAWRGEPAPTDVEVREITRTDLLGSRRGRTFDGRDRFAPAAAALARGDSFESLGPPVDDPVLLERRTPRRRSDGFVGEIVHIDRFGNAITNVPGEWLAHSVAVRIAGDSEPLAVRNVLQYSELADGQPGVLVGSQETLELALRGRSFAERYGAVIQKEILFAIR